MGDDRPKRRLPVIQAGPPPEEAEVERPRWHAIVTTSLSMLLGWILLAWIVNGVVGARVRAGEADLVVTLANLAVFVVAGALAGALTGRYSLTAGRREALLGGLVTAVLGWSVPFAWVVLAGTTARAAGAWLALLVAMAAVAALATGLGFKLGRPKSATDTPPVG